MDEIVAEDMELLLRVVKVAKELVSEHGDGRWEPMAVWIKLDKALAALEAEERPTNVGVHFGVHYSTGRYGNICDECARLQGMEPYDAVLEEP